MTTLIALLLLQLTIAGLLYSSDSNMDNDISPRLLLGLQQDTVQKIHIKDESSELTLVNINGHWQLKDHPALPLLSDKVNLMAKELSNTKVSWPITKTVSSHERFKVSENKFEKHIVFSNDKGESDALLLGESPSFKQLYARNVNDEAVYLIPFSAYQLSTENNDWLDKSLLAVDSISQINHSKLNLKKHESTWELASPSVLDEQQTLDNESIQNLVSQITSLTVSGIANNSPEATEQLVITNEQGKAFTFSLSSNEANYFIKRDDYNEWFTLPKTKFEQLANLSFNKFIVTNSKQEEEKLEKTSD